MNTYFLKNLAKHIVGEQGVSKTQAKKIMDLLSTHDLRTLMKYIALEEEKNTAYVTSADELSKKDTEAISQIFGGRKIVNTVDKKIGAGISAQVYDMIYDLSVRSKVGSMIQELEEEL